MGVGANLLDQGMGDTLVLVSDENGPDQYQGYYVNGRRETYSAKAARVAQERAWRTNASARWNRACISVSLLFRKDLKLFHVVGILNGISDPEAACFAGCLVVWLLWLRSH
jgi:hypothetical protein